MSIHKKIGTVFALTVLLLIPGTVWAESETESELVETAPVNEDMEGTTAIIESDDEESDLKQSEVEQPETLPPAAAASSDEPQGEAVEPVPAQEQVEIPRSATVTEKIERAATTAGEWRTTKGRLWYRNGDGSYTTSDFQKIGGRWYYFDQEGYLVTGWKKVGKSWYYLKKGGSAGEQGRVLTGWRLLGGKMYYLKKTGDKGIYGRMLTGLQNIGGHTYRFASSGEMLTGWQNSNGSTFYFKRTGDPGIQGRMLRGFQNIGGKTFYFKKTGEKGIKGRMLTGWQSIGGKRYYFKATGAAGVKGQRFQGGWIRVGGKEYFFLQDGVLQATKMTEREFVAYIGPLAREDMKKTKILASITAAQAILESGYGSTELAVQANNLFGMKASLSGNTWASQWKGQTYDKKTIEYDANNKPYTEVATFRKYNSHAASIKDHSDYLAGAKNGSKLRYQGVVGNKDYRATAKLIKAGGYATDPKYVDKLCDIIERWKLTQYDC